MKALIIFSITTIISFLGSFHPGPLNMSVIQATLRKSLIAGLWMTVGGVLPEIIYGYLAVEGLKVFDKYPQVFEIMQWAILPVLLLIGWKYLKPKQMQEELSKSEEINVDIEVTSYWGDFIKGFLLSFLNPQLMAFWLVILINYQNYEYLKIEFLFDKIAFVLGASTGALILNYLCALVAIKKKGAIFQYLSQNMFDKIMGWTFFLIAFVQVIKLLVF